ncbi:hypothetical protein C8039_11905 [Halogeometricum sp. wsp3]|nr:hypothetical protein C8039_11905 [Halogeometricum sp. wsp3]
MLTANKLSSSLQEAGFEVVRSVPTSDGVGTARQERPAGSAVSVLSLSERSKSENRTDPAHTGWLPSVTLLELRVCWCRNQGIVRRCFSSRPGHDSGDRTDTATG